MVDYFAILLAFENHVRQEIYHSSYTNDYENISQKTHILVCFMQVKENLECCQVYSSDHVSESYG